MTQAPVKTELPSSYTTFEDFISRANGEVFFAEWIDGKVEYRMPSGTVHQLTLRFLLQLLSLYVERHQLGETLFAPFSMRLPKRPSGREPDLMFIASENLSRLTRTYLDGPADLAVEIVSPESIERDYETKRLEYAQNGVREYWCIDPDKQSVLFCQLTETGTYNEITLSTGRYKSSTVAGFWLQDEWLWREPQPLMEAPRLDCLPRRQQTHDRICFW